MPDIWSRLESKRQQCEWRKEACMPCIVHCQVPSSLAVLGQIWPFSISQYYVQCASLWLRLIQGYHTIVTFPDHCSDVDSGFTLFLDSKGVITAHFWLSFPWSLLCNFLLQILVICSIFLYSLCSSSLLMLFAYLGDLKIT